MGGFVAERTASQRDGYNPSASCLPCLRDKYRGDSLSTEASFRALVGLLEDQVLPGMQLSPCSENGLKEISKLAGVEVSYFLRSFS